MTREELREHCEKQIEQCKLWAKSRGEKPSGHVYEEHLLILELLKQEPCEDAISRQAVLDMAYDMSEIDGEHFTEPCMVVEVEDIEKLPPVTTVREHGEWIERIDRDDYNDYEHIWYECTKCHRDADRPFDFCPRCGADMRGKQK